MKYILLLIILTIKTIAFAQNDCNCNNELKYVIKYYEDNLPAFKGDINKTNIKEYNDFKKHLNQESLKVKSKTACYKLLLFYVEYFRDNHSSIRMNFPQINENNDNDVTKFLQSDIYKSTEIHQLVKQDEKEYPLSDIRGVYHSENKNYIIAIIPSKTKFRDYIGVIIDSKSKLWKRGQVKLELKAKDDGEYQAFIYLDNHSIKYTSRYAFNKGILGPNWFKSNLVNKTNFALSTDDALDFRVINDSIAYLRLPTFDAGQTTVFDSIYSVADPIIRKTPYLVVDVRNNDGGSSTNIKPLIDYTYTNPIINDFMELYATKGNLKIWEEWYGYMLKDTANYSEILPVLKSRIEKIKSAELPSFIPLYDGVDTTISKSIIYPKRVAILFDRGCASSCELLLLIGRQSSKTILVGENSAGYIGYGENGNVQTPCYGFTLSCTMTRYHSQRKYEVIGISPDYSLNYNKDWLDQTIELLLAEF